MILRNSYYYFKSAISEKLCDQIIERGEEEMVKIKEQYGEGAISATTNGQLQRGGKRGGNKPINDLDAEDVKKAGIKENDLYVRDTKISWIKDSWIFDLIFPFAAEANTIAGWNFDLDMAEPFQYTKYDKDQFYGWHIDVDDPYVYVDPDNPWASFDQAKNIPASRQINIPGLHGKVRKLSVTVNLSKPTEYEGGNLNFDFGQLVTPRYYTCTEIRPRGSIIVFPSHIYHQVTPITKGTRRSLVMWCCGNPFK